VIAPSYAIVIALICVASILAADRHRLVGSALGWLAMGGFYFVLWFVYPRGLGYGDVRLAGLLGLALGYIGWSAVLTGMYAGFLLGGVGGGVLALLRVVNRKRFAFGPFMLLGSLVGLGWGKALADWYTSR
jgi:leader peptidase (prepilin peptidase)/N-methyltransferase